MIPFDMARFDGRRDANSGTQERRRPVVERILETAKVGGIDLKAVSIVWQVIFLFMVSNSG